MYQSRRNKGVTAFFSFTIAALIVGGIFSILIASASFEQFIFDSIRLKNTVERSMVREAIHAYLAGGATLPHALFTDREMLHMQDVRTIIYAERTIVLLVGLVLVVIFAHGCISMSEWRVLIHKASLWLFAMLLFGGIFGIFFFDEFFTLFHELLFTNDLWLLDPAQSALIRSYPPVFFSSFFLQSGVVICCIGASMWLLSRKGLKYRN